MSPVWGDSPPLAAVQEVCQLESPHPQGSAEQPEVKVFTRGPLLQLITAANSPPDTRVKPSPRVGPMQLWMRAGSRRLL